MPNTLHALDTLFARLLRTATIIAVVVILTQAPNGFAHDAQILGSSAVAIAFAIGRSFVKANGYRDLPGRGLPADRSAGRDVLDRPRA